MKYFSWIMKLAVVLLALPVVALMILEGICLVFTDGFPGLFKKLSLSASRLNN
jgi:hypothetical protein